MEHCLQEGKEYPEAAGTAEGQVAYSPGEHARPVGTGPGHANPLGMSPHVHGPHLGHHGAPVQPSL